MCRSAVFCLFKWAEKFVEHTFMQVYLPFRTESYSSSQSAADEDDEVIPVCSIRSIPTSVMNPSKLVNRQTNAFCYVRVNIALFGVVSYFEMNFRTFLFQVGYRLPRASPKQIHCDWSYWIMLQVAPHHPGTLLKSL